MKEIGISEWQEMAIKKDIEEIKRKQNSQTSIFLSLGWEVAVTYGTVLYDQLFDLKITDVLVLTLIVAGAVLPAIIVLLLKFIEWISSVIKAKSGKLSVKDFVDLFDNQMSYWVMLGNSYADMLEHQINSKQCSDSELEFLYCEGCYYNNKTIKALYEMKPVVDKVFSGNLDAVKLGNHVDISRLQSLISVMNEQQNRLDEMVNKKKNSRILLQQNLNEKYISDLKDVFTDLNAAFKENQTEPDLFSWKDYTPEKNELINAPN